MPSPDESGTTSTVESALTALKGQLNIVQKTQLEQHGDIASVEFQTRDLTSYVKLGLSEIRLQQKHMNESAKAQQDHLRETMEKQQENVVTAVQEIKTAIKDFPAQIAVLKHQADNNRTDSGPQPALGNVEKVLSTAMNYPRLFSLLLFVFCAGGAAFWWYTK